MSSSTDNSESDEDNFSDSKRSKVYSCKEIGCNASYTKPFRLEIHNRTKHTGERPFVCDIEGCTSSYTNIAHLKRHKTYVHENVVAEVMCTVSGCGKVFSNKYNLKKHTNKHHSTSGDVFKCAICLEAFKKKRQLKAHLYSHIENTLKCTVCNVSFGSLHLLNKHKKSHKTYTCDCGSVFNKWTLFCAHRRKSCTVKKIDHKCVICNKVLTTSWNLKVHSMTHLEESQSEVFRCAYLDCNRSYKYKKNLSAHIATYHEKKNDEVKIRCTHEGCDSILKSKKNLRQHLAKIHSGVPKKERDRRKRKDKGKRRKCMASIVSGVSLPLEQHAAILKGSNPSSTIVSNSSEELANITSSKTVVEDILKDNEEKLESLKRNEANKELDNQIVTRNQSSLWGRS